MKYKKTIIITILLMILLIPFKVEAGDYKIMLSYFSNGGTVSSGNIEVISGVVFIKNSTKVDITYSSNQTINHINSLDGTNTFTLKNVFIILVPVAIIIGIIILIVKKKKNKSKEEKKDVKKG